MAFEAGTLDNPVVLLEWEAGYRLDQKDWEQDETYTNCWLVLHPEGLPTKVEEDGEKLTSRASLSLCHDNAGSYYYEVGVGLYVHTTGSDDPSGYIILSYFLERIASESPVIYNGKYYLPQISLDSLPNLTSAISMYGAGGVQQSFGSIKLINADGYWDSRLATYIYEAKSLRILIGNRGDDYEDFECVWRGWSGDIAWSDLEIVIDTKDMREITPNVE